MKNVILVLFLCMSLQIFPVHTEAIKELSSKEETNEVVEEKMNFFEDLHYRIIYKDTKDFYDYVILGTAIVALLIVMVLQNTHYVIVTKPLEEEKFLESESDYSIEEVEEEKEIIEEIEVKEEIETNSEILSSNLLEEEQVPKKRKSKNTKKKRA